MMTQPEFLDGEPIYHETPRPPAYGAVAILDPVHPELLDEEE
jgi:hypothetical protein